MRRPGTAVWQCDGFNYNYFRDYDPSTGRYVQSDPIGLGGGISTYGYVGGSPFSKTDRFGLSEATRAIGGVGLVDALRANTAADEAEQAARDAELIGQSSGPSDAYRHCVWSCLMTQRIGRGQAQFVGDNHEIEGRSNGQLPSDEAMDRANNQVGRGCGLLRDVLTCPQRCMVRLRRGGLFGPGGRPMPPIVPDAADRQQGGY
jgi:RHS repeat-associated protein